jgi:hypothetical protein
MVSVGERFVSFVKWYLRCVYTFPFCRDHDVHVGHAGCCLCHYTFVYAYMYVGTISA